MQSLENEEQEQISLMVDSMVNICSLKEIIKGNADIATKKVAKKDLKREQKLFLKYSENVLSIRKKIERKKWPRALRWMPFLCFGC